MAHDQLQAITAAQNVFMLNGQRWSPKGICYQPIDNVDPISDDNFETIQHLLDPATQYGLSNLGINCLRVYQVDPAKSHDKVMQLLADHGIYVLVGAVNSDTGVPANAVSVPAKTVKRVIDVADAFAGYVNVLGFDIENELLDNTNSQNYVLVDIVRTIKQALQAHLANKGHRAIPIGCCTRDVPAYTLEATRAYVCGDAASRMDFLGYNCYRWALPHGREPDASALDQYYKLYIQFQPFPVPVMLTEFGAHCIGGRDWKDVPYIYGKKLVSSAPPESKQADLSQAISGGFAFRYLQHAQTPTQNLGLVDQGSPFPQPVTSGDGGGYLPLSREYHEITGFGGAANGIDVLECASLKGNPYVDAGPKGGLTEPTKVMLTNAISPAREIVFSYSYSSAPKNDDWIEAAKIPAAGATQAFTFPRGTQSISMAYQVDGNWYGGCQLHGAQVAALCNGQTIQGQWVAPDGNGVCQVD